MTWYGWLIIGVILGIAAASALVAAVGRESEERGGTLTFDSPDARAVFKQPREASQTRGYVGEKPNYRWPVVVDPDVPEGQVRLLTPAENKLQRLIRRSLEQ